MATVLIGIIIASVLGGVTMFKATTSTITHTITQNGGTSTVISTSTVTIISIMTTTSTTVISTTTQTITATPASYQVLFTVNSVTLDAADDSWMVNITNTGSLTLHVTATLQNLIGNLPGGNSNADMTFLPDVASDVVATQSQSGISAPLVTGNAYLVCVTGQHNALGSYGILTVCNTYST